VLRYVSSQTDDYPGRSSVLVIIRLPLYHFFNLDQHTFCQLFGVPLFSSAWLFHLPALAWSVPLATRLPVSITHLAYRFNLGPAVRRPATAHMFSLSRLSALALAVVATAVHAQSGFEPSDFNVTEALADLGINVTALPELAELSQRSSTFGCSIAVSLVRTRHVDWMLILPPVQFAQAFLRQLGSGLSGRTILRCFHQRLLVSAATSC
jgi:hypothetical protein